GPQPQYGKPGRNPSSSEFGAQPPPGSGAEPRFRGVGGAAPGGRGAAPGGGLGAQPPVSGRGGAGGQNHRQGEETRGARAPHPAGLGARAPPPPGEGGGPPRAPAGPAGTAGYAQSWPWSASTAASVDSAV